MTIKMISPRNREQVVAFFQEHWGSPQMIISTGVYDCSKLDGFIYEAKNTIEGLLTYVIHDDSIKIISLDSVKEGQGIGSQLMNAVEFYAGQQGILKITLITTNDNLNALKFYQKRGYRIVNVIPDAVAKAREQKPSIPYIGNDGIPLHDELILSKTLSEKKDGHNESNN